MHKELDEKSFKNAVNKNLNAGSSESNSAKTPSDPPYIPTFVLDLEPELDKDDWLWGPLNLRGDTLASHRILSLYSTLAGISGTNKVGSICIISTLPAPLILGLFLPHLWHIEADKSRARHQKVKQESWRGVQ